MSKKPRVTRESLRRMEMFEPINTNKEVASEGGYFGPGRRKSDDRVTPSELSKILSEQRRLRDSGMVFEK